MIFLKWLGLFVFIWVLWLVLFRKKGEGVLPVKKVRENEGARLSKKKCDRDWDDESPT